MKTVIGSAVIAFLMLSGCQSSQQNLDTSSDSIQSYVADLSCDASFQCKVIGVGERRACGGPSRYVVFSTKTVDENELERLVAAETSKEQLLNEALSGEETCKQVLPIQSLCIRNKCESFPISN
jgi:hypothetical protein